MTEEDGRGVPHLPHEEVQVRVYMLADHAVQEQNGKLYVNGGAVEWVGLRPSANRLPPLWLVVRLGFPWRLTSGGHVIEVRILDQDEKPIGIDPFMRADAQLGRPPGAEPGDEFALNIVVPLGGYELSTVPDSKVIFHLLVDDHEIGTLPLKIRRLVQAPGLAP